MAKNTFNSHNIQNLKPPTKAKYVLYKYESYKTLALKITDKGTKTFIAVLPDSSRVTLGRLTPKFGLKAARKKAEEQRSLYDEGIKSNKQPKQKPIEVPTFVNLCTKYIEWAANNKKANTVKSDAKRLTNHAIPILGNKPANQITNRDISSLLNNLKNKNHTYTYLKTINNIPINKLKESDFVQILKDLGYKGNLKIDFEELDRDSLFNAINYHIKDKETVSRYFKYNTEQYSITKKTTQGTANRLKAIISHMYNTAMTWNEPEWECIKFNPCIGIKSKQSNSKTRYLDKNELSRLNDILNKEEYQNHTVALLIKFLLFTGARRSEATNARWEHIDFNNRLWRKPDSKSQTKLAPPVPLSNVTINLLEDMKKISNKGYIFKSPTLENKPIGEFRRSFNTIMKKANIENCTPHDLRRTFGSQLLLQGVDIYTVSKLLGHNSVATTEKHYAFLNRETLHNAVNALDNLLG